MSPIPPPSLDAPESKPEYDVLEHALAILVQGPVANPRASFQAKASFQAHWRIVVARKLDQGDEPVIRPVILAAIILLHYAWPDVFASIVIYPHLFFYLHSLIQEKPNEVCNFLEIEEYRDLGYPCESDSLLSKFLRQPDLVRFFGALPLLPSGFGINELMRHFTLNRSDIVPLGVNVETAWAALTSGDPVRIKLADYAIAFVDTNTMQAKGELQTYREQMVRDLDALANSSAQEPEELIKKVERAVFAFGLIQEETFVELISERLSSPQVLPQPIMLRTIYALGHRADRSGPSQQMAARTLVDLLKE